MKLVKLPSGNVLNLDAACALGKHGLDGSLQVTFIGQSVVLQGSDADALRVYMDEHCDMATPTPRAEAFADVIAGGR
ncbi:MAG TPA: hypothetical protein VFF77_00040 [Holophagaceae bacterium]|nr:hypothetical protein [Holophagaceae bacterium]